MRLIDADAEIQKVEEEHNRCLAKIERLEKLKSEEPNNNYHNWDKEIKQAKENTLYCEYEIAVLRKCGTTYNVDKVAEKLKAEKQESYSENYFAYGNGIGRAVEIVEGGGQG